MLRLQLATHGNLKTVNISKALQGGSSIIDLPFVFFKSVTSSIINQPLVSILCSCFTVRVNRKAGKFVYLRESVYWQLRLRGCTRNSSYLRINMLKTCYSYPQLNFMDMGNSELQLHLRFCLVYVNLKLQTLCTAVLFCHIIIPLWLQHAHFCGPSFLKQILDLGVILGCTISS